jgi:ATP-dependent RNA helicase DeaD
MVRESNYFLFKTEKDALMKNKFTLLSISDQFVEHLSLNGIINPTPVQSQVIPVLHAGKDVIAQAQTGTGKTLSFLLPMMERIDPSKKCVQALIITPTRELALQITNEAKKLGAIRGINILPVYGGQDVEKQKRRLKSITHIVIGTPGRLLDHISHGSVNFTLIKMLVLDEADQMLNMGFIRDVEKIIHHCARHRQTILCSATMPGAIIELAKKYLHSPEHIKVAGNNVTLESTKQLVVELTDDKKQETLCSLLDEYKPFLSIIFCRTKRRAQALNKMLKIRGYASDELHGDLTQGKREQVMRAFREMRTQYLVATDVAARGLDIDGITHVFNYDIPRDAESYIHRIGRTGRAGQKGCAITFVAQGDRAILSVIERGIKLKIVRRSMGNEPAGAKHSAVRSSAHIKAVSVSYDKRKPYSAESSPGRTGKGSRKFAGDNRPASPCGRSARKKNAGNNLYRDTALGEERPQSGAGRRVDKKPFNGKSVNPVRNHTPHAFKNKYNGSSAGSSKQNVGEKYLGMSGSSGERKKAFKGTGSKQRPSGGEKKKSGGNHYFSAQRVPSRKK